MIQFQTRLLKKGKVLFFDIKSKRLGDQLYTKANINKTRHILGYESRSSLEEALRTQISWYKEKTLSHSLHKLKS